MGEWLTRGSNPDNRIAVLNGWLSLLQPHATRRLHPSEFSDVVNQMLHRAASACAAGQAPAMAYLQFTPLPSGRVPDIGALKSDLARLHGLLGAPSGFPFSVIEVEIMETEAFQKIKGLPKEAASAPLVRAALMGKPLFQFLDVRTHVISE